MAAIADRRADIHRRHGSGAIGWYYGNPGAFSYSHTLSLSMFMAGFGPRLHVFTAGSQDVNNRFVASQLLYGSPLAIPVPDVLRTDFLVVIGANPVVSHGRVLTPPPSSNGWASFPTGTPTCCCRCCMFCSARTWSTAPDWPGRPPAGCGSSRWRGKSGPEPTRRAPASAPAP